MIAWHDDLHSGYSYSVDTVLRDGIHQLADVCEHGIGYHFRVWVDGSEGGVWLVRSDDLRPPYESLKAAKQAAELYMRTGKKPKLTRIIEKIDYSA